MKKSHSFLILTIIVLMGLLTVINSNLNFLGLETNEKRAAYARCKHDMTVVLDALHDYRESHGGRFPNELTTLVGFDSRLTAIDMSVYTFSSNGTWTLSMPHPTDKDKLMVGRLPQEITVLDPTK